MDNSKNIINIIMHKKVESMTQFDIFHNLVENSVNSDFFSEVFSKQPKSAIHQKMPMVEQLKNQGLVNPSIKSN